MRRTGWVSSCFDWGLQLMAVPESRDVVRRTDAIRVCGRLRSKCVERTLTQNCRTEIERLDQHGIQTSAGRHGPRMVRRHAPQTVSSTGFRSDSFAVDISAFLKALLRFVAIKPDSLF